MTTKVYTAVQRINTGAFNAYAHVGSDVAFLSNAKLTTHKRELAEATGAQLTNWSYKVDGTPVDGSKVYAIVRRVVTANGIVYIPALGDAAYLTRKAASEALRAAGGGKKGSDKTLVIYSFVVGQPIREFQVVVTAKARSQAEANRMAEGHVIG